MSNSKLYPTSPAEIPEGFTLAKSSYKRQAMLAMLGLTCFMLFYVSLTACFGYIAYVNILSIQAGYADIFQYFIAGMSSVLTIFMAKSIFTVRKSGNPGGVEVTEENEKELFQFLHQLADEVGAPKPHRVFITPEVNAAVFYDLSLANLIFPSKKNLVIGLGLVNVLNLGELKAVLAHEFGHFAQGSMAVGRWVYIAQQIIAHMVATRDWLDSIVRFISRIDLRTAWIGWLLGLVIWSIRSLMDTLFSIVIIAERALSREMEFNADLVAVSVTGSDALVNALHKLQAADEAWQTTLDVAGREAGSGKYIGDLFDVQRRTISAIGKVINDESYGLAPIPEVEDHSQHRVFTEQLAAPPQMWSTHPANRDREDNAKSVYISAEIDERDSWIFFSNPEALREKISHSFYNAEKINEMEIMSADTAVEQRFSRASFSSHFRGTYLSRSPVRNFSSVKELLQSAQLPKITLNIVDDLYPETLTEQLEMARSLDLERNTLQALASGTLKPSGGVIRHRGEELKKSEIPKAIEQIARERKALANKLNIHDANCRKAHLLIAKHLGGGWKDYLMSLINLLHCTEHLSAVVSNEHALLVNTWQVITADGQIGHFEKKRILKVCKQAQEIIRTVSSAAIQIQLPQTIIDETGIENWQEQCPTFEIADVDKKNWPEWCQTASKMMDHLEYALNIVRSSTLEELIKTESSIAKHFSEKTIPEAAPAVGSCPADYPILLPGDEHVLQQKLDLWNRFQLAHGVVPTTMRLIIAMGIVGGTVYTGFVGF